MLHWHKPKGADAFWERYGQLETGVGTNFRLLVYQGMHIGGALIEGQRLGRKDTQERGYRDLKSTVALLQVLLK